MPLIDIYHTVYEPDALNWSGTKEVPNDKKKYIKFDHYQVLEKGSRTLIFSDEDYLYFVIQKPGGGRRGTVISNVFIFDISDIIGLDLQDLQNRLETHTVDTLSRHSSNDHHFQIDISSSAVENENDSINNVQIYYILSNNGVASANLREVSLFFNFAPSLVSEVKYCSEPTNRDYFNIIDDGQKAPDGKLFNRLMEEYRDGDHQSASTLPSIEDVYKRELNSTTFDQFYDEIGDSYNGVSKYQSLISRENVETGITNKSIVLINQEVAIGLLQSILPENLNKDIESELKQRIEEFTRKELPEPTDEQNHSKLLEKSSRRIIEEVERTVVSLVPQISETNQLDPRVRQCIYGLYKSRLGESVQDIIRRISESNDNIDCGNLMVADFNDISNEIFEIEVGIAIELARNWCRQDSTPFDWPAKWAEEESPLSPLPKSLVNDLADSIKKSRNNIFQAWRNEESPENTVFTEKVAQMLVVETVCAIKHYYGARSPFNALEIPEEYEEHRQNNPEVKSDYELNDESTTKSQEESEADSTLLSDFAIDKHKVVVALVIFGLGVGVGILTSGILSACLVGCQTEQPQPSVEIRAPNNISEDTENTFKANLSGSEKNTTIQWTFGDGSRTTGKVVQNTYTTAGNYTIRVAVKNESANITDDSITVTVNSPPNASVIANKTVLNTSEAVRFDGTNSSDPNDGDSITYIWLFNDGTNASNSTVVHRYDTAGNYTVTLIVKDKFGGLACVLV